MIINAIACYLYRKNYLKGGGHGNFDADFFPMYSLGDKQHFLITKFH